MLIKFVGWCSFSGHKGIADVYKPDARRHVAGVGLSCACFDVVNDPVGQNVLSHEGKVNCSWHGFASTLKCCLTHAYTSYACQFQMGKASRSSCEFAGVVCVTAPLAARPLCLPVWGRRFSNARVYFCRSLLLLGSTSCVILSLDTPCAQEAKPGSAWR